MSKENLLKQIKNAKMTNSDKAQLIYFLLSLKMKPKRLGTKIKS